MEEEMVTVFIIKFLLIILKLMLKIETQIMIWF